MALVDLAGLSQIASDQVRLLWVNDWFDGPREAIVEHGGEHFLLVPHDRQAVAEQVPPYRWLLYRLSADRFVEEQRWHALFCHHVGDHWCFHPDMPHAPETGERDPSVFYAAVEARPARDLDAETPFGWVDQMPTG